MHSAAQAQITDSMRMYQLGVDRGKPTAGEIGAAPEWFYKGSGTILRGHNQPLDVPAYAEDGGEEPERIAFHHCSPALSGAMDQLDQSHTASPV